MQRVFSVALGIWVCLLGIVTVVYAEDLAPIPRFTGYVVDSAEMLSPGDRVELEVKLATLTRERGTQIALLTVPTVQPEAIEQYAVRAFEVWKVGRKGIDDGILLVVVRDDRQLRIEVGYGLEGSVTDAHSKRIIDEIIVPELRAGEAGKGIKAGVEALEKLVRGEELPPPGQGFSSSTSELAANPEKFIIFPFIICATFGGLLRRFLGRGATALLAGGGVLGFLVFSQIPILIALAITAFCIIISQSNVQTSSGGRGSSRSGGSSFGGGGGGRSGGGGASGRW